MKQLEAVTFAIFLVFSARGYCEEGMVWTDRPVRIDRTKQSFERLPRLTLGVEGGKTISFPLRLQMHDSTSFTTGEKDYVLTDLSPIAANRLCRSPQGVRWPCGRDAAVYVSNLFRGRAITCKAVQGADATGLSQCRTPTLNLVYDIVAKGFAFPRDDDSELGQALMEAKQKSAGIWRDAGCGLSDHSC